jgi:hypothetical protein
MPDCDAEAWRIGIGPRDFLDLVGVSGEFPCVIVGTHMFPSGIVGSSPR